VEALSLAELRMTAENLYLEFRCERSAMDTHMTGAESLLRAAEHCAPSVMTAANFVYTV
jgi:hypothetical protein